MNNPINISKFIRQAVTNYIESGQADQLILDRLSKLDDRPRCEKCCWWDKQTMYCLNARSLNGTTQPIYVCDYFAKEEES